VIVRMLGPGRSAGALAGHTALIYTRDGVVG
jgi:hypothetical protein